MSKNIILCGVGGQGTILASRLIATAAMDKNIPIKTAETIGMASAAAVFSATCGLARGPIHRLLERVKST